MGGQTKVDFGICRIWVFLNDDACRAFCAGAEISSLIAGLCDPEMISKIALVCAGVVAAVVSMQNKGNGVIFKIPYVPAIALLRPPEIVPQ